MGCKHDLFPDAAATNMDGSYGLHRRHTTNTDGSYRLLCPWWHWSLEGYVLHDYTVHPVKDTATQRNTMSAILNDGETLSSILF